MFKIFTDIFQNYKKVDLIFLQETPIMLQSRAVFDGELIYKENSNVEFQYREYVMKKHADTQYFRQMRQEVILARV